MNIVKTEQPQGTVCRLEGRFDAHVVPQVRAALEPVRQPLFLDLSGVGFIDSSGLAALVGLFKKAREAGVLFEISGIQDPVRLILELTGLDAILPIRVPGRPQ